MGETHWAINWISNRRLLVGQPGCGEVGCSGAGVLRGNSSPARLQRLPSFALLLAAQLGHQTKCKPTNRVAGPMNCVGHVGPGPPVPIARPSRVPLTCYAAQDWPRRSEPACAPVLKSGRTGRGQYGKGDLRRRGVAISRGCSCGRPTMASALSARSTSKTFTWARGHLVNSVSISVMAHSSFQQETGFRTNP
jgi:hypothetical protein